MRLRRVIAQAIDSQLLIGLSVCVGIPESDSQGAPFFSAGVAREIP